MRGPCDCSQRHYNDGLHNRSCLALQRWRHDCAKCVYIGSRNSRDVYFCPGIMGGSWIARHGDNNSDYASFPGDLLSTIRRNGGGRTDEYKAIIAVMEGTE